MQQEQDPKPIEAPDADKPTDEKPIETPSDLPDPEDHSPE
jgi:hypothetical protein